MDAVEGETETVIPVDEGDSVTVAVPLAVELNTLVAVAVTVVVLAIEAGAMYKPLAFIEPSEGEMLHVTALLKAPLTTALNCCSCDGPSVTVPGFTDTVTVGVNCIDAVVVWPSARLVAVTVTVCGVKTEGGAVYRPADVIEPMPAGVMVHVTPKPALFVRVAVNCCVCPPDSDAVGGVTETVDGGYRVTVADWVQFGLLTPVAVTVTVCAEVMVAGAV